jgi:hypothetical protein
VTGVLSLKMEDEFATQSYLEANSKFGNRFVSRTIQKPCVEYVGSSNYTAHSDFTSIAY